MRLRNFVIGTVVFLLITTSVLAVPKSNPPGLAKGHYKKDSAQIGMGLREALRIGTQNAVTLIGKQDGYFKNVAIKILMPKELGNLEDALRRLGQGSQVDEFVLSMNRAAEQSVPAAKEIFWNAIKGISFRDAREILIGDDTAATEYFRAKTSVQLTEAFKPAVTKTMDEVGVTRQYKQLALRTKDIKFIKVEMVDIDQYVVTKTLDGLFFMVGREEKKIRKDPGARVTKLLKDIFGN